MQWVHSLSEPVDMLTQISEQIILWLIGVRKACVCRLYMPCMPDGPDIIATPAISSYTSWVDYKYNPTICPIRRSYWKAMSETCTSRTLTPIETYIWECHSYRTIAVVLPHITTHLLAFTMTTNMIILLSLVLWNNTTIYIRRSNGLWNNTTTYIRRINVSSISMQACISQVYLVILFYSFTIGLDGLFTWDIKMMY